MIKILQKILAAPVEYENDAVRGLKAQKLNYPRLKGEGFGDVG